ncbi:MAG: tRNA lysidine(34) synthetase TilS [Deltaproteobacteria bacterium]|nr:tRNA lysidine(34) synthetase TilS [Deltaproteobacteria bacterium]
MSTRAPSIVTIVKRALSSEVALPRGSTLLVAVSGGADSMVLLHVLARLAPSFGITLRAHGVDHGLRPEASAELDAAEGFARSLEVPFGRSTAEVARGGNLQARARNARHALLRAAAVREGARAIATAHHADDRAETVLMRLMRGAGARGLGVLPPRAPAATSEIELVRPLLRARRAAVRAHAARHGIPFADDPSNADPRYLRARVRQDVLPVLERLAPGVVDHLTALADELGQGSTPASNGPSAGAFPFDLPRATQIALVDLARSRSASARVWLPHGLVVTVDPRARPGKK